MPTSKSSTSNEETTRPIRAHYLSWAVQDDYKAMLDELLSVVHMDGGQYTTLAGYAVSLEDAVTRVTTVRRELSRLQMKMKKE